MEIGSSYNRLTCVEKGKIDKKYGYYLFTCDCGTEKVISGYDVEHEKIKSCGCLLRETTGNIKRGKSHSEETKRKMSKALQGRTHSEETKKKMRNVKLGRNNPMYGRTGNKNPMFGRTHSVETKKRISETQQGEKGNAYGRIGEKNPMWKGGISPLYQRIRAMSEYDRWRSQIFKRDRYTCQICGKRGMTLEIHHIMRVKDIILWYSVASLDDARKCAILWDITNGVVLCADCHKGIHHSKFLEESSVVYIYCK